MIHIWGVFLHLNFAFTDSVNKSEILHCDFQEASPSLINAVNNVNDVVNLVNNLGICTLMVLDLRKVREWVSCS